MDIKEFVKKLVSIPVGHEYSGEVTVLGDCYDEEVIVEILKGGNLEDLESLVFNAFPVETDKDSEHLCEMLECHFFKVRLLNHFPDDTETLGRWLKSGDVNSIREFLRDEYDSSEFMSELIDDLNIFGAYFSEDSIEIPVGD